MAVLPGETASTRLIGCAVMEAERSTGGGATPPPGDAWNALSYLLSGFLMFGGIGALAYIFIPFLLSVPSVPLW